MTWLEFTNHSDTGQTKTYISHGLETERLVMLLAQGSEPKYPQTKGRAPPEAGLMLLQARGSTTIADRHQHPHHLVMLEGRTAKY